MFTWICPTCGREVPPSYDQCPDCAAKGIKQPPQSAAPGPTTTPASLPTPVPVAAPPRSGLAIPTWALAIIFALVLIGLGAAAIWFFHSSSSGAMASGPAPAAAGTPATPGKEHLMQKYIEVSGIRFIENSKKETEARFLVINHSGADVSDLAATVSVFGRAGKTEEAAGTFSFKLSSLGPYESKEATAPIETKLKVYELPDWQFVTTQVQITSP